MSALVTLWKFTSIFNYWNNLFYWIIDNSWVRIMNEEYISALDLHKSSCIFRAFWKRLLRTFEALFDICNNPFFLLWIFWLLLNQTHLPKKTLSQQYTARISFDTRLYSFLLHQGHSYPIHYAFSEVEQFFKYL